MKKMSRWNKKRKQWLDKKSRDGNKKKKRSQGIVSPPNSFSNVERSNSRQDPPYVTLYPPTNFSIVNNPDETMSFFQNFADEINSLRIKSQDPNEKNLQIKETER